MIASTAAAGLDVHLEGSPHDMGVQHGYLMAQEIADFYGVVRLEMTHNTGRNWDFFRRAGREMLGLKIDGEYQGRTRLPARRSSTVCRGESTIVPVKVALAGANAGA